MCFIALCFPHFARFIECEISLHSTFSILSYGSLFSTISVGEYHFLLILYVMVLLPTGAPYSGKASDMWALGVVLFTMLYGQFPFYDSVPHELFRKIKAADYKMPKYVC